MKTILLLSLTFITAAANAQSIDHWTRTSCKSFEDGLKVCLKFQDVTDTKIHKKNLDLEETDLSQLIKESKVVITFENQSDSSLKNILVKLNNSMGDAIGLNAQGGDLRVYSQFQREGRWKVRNLKPNENANMSLDLIVSALLDLPRLSLERL